MQAVPRKSNKRNDKRESCHHQFVSGMGASCLRLFLLNTNHGDRFVFLKVFVLVVIGMVNKHADRS